MQDMSLLFLGALASGAILAMTATAVRAAESPLTPGDLRCEFLSDPLGIDVAEPRLSWVLQSSDVAARGEAQTAYRILVASTPERLAKDEGDLWDSGRVESDRSIHVAYAGKPLASHARCHWKVRAWDKGGRASAWSPTALWTMGILRPEEWRASTAATRRRRVTSSAACPRGTCGVSSASRGRSAGPPSRSQASACTNCT